MLANGSWYLTKSNTAEEKPENGGAVKGPFIQPQLMFQQFIDKASLGEEQRLA